MNRSFWRGLLIGTLIAVAVLVSAKAVFGWEYVFVATYPNGPYDLDSSRIRVISSDDDGVVADSIYVTKTDTTMYYFNDTLVLALRQDHNVIAEWFSNVFGRITTNDQVNLTALGYADNIPDPGDTNLVRVYADFGSSEGDTTYGLPVPREGKAYLMLSGEGRYYHDGSWILIPRQHEAPISDEGRAVFLVVPNTLITPAGTCYELSIQPRDGRSRGRSVVARFVVDTLVDPVNFIDCAVCN